MIKRLVFVLLISFLSAVAFSQKLTLKVTMEDRVAGDKNDTIFYSSSRPLTWDDFQGKPDYNNVGGAITSSGFALDASMTMDGDQVNLNVKVVTFFSKSNSWKKPNINSDYHLLHEQHHFDITRISAQKFYNDLLAASFTMANYNKLLTTIFNRDFEENNILQQQYDGETKHSIDSTMQFKWNDKIASQVKLLH